MLTSLFAKMRKSVSQIQGEAKVGPDRQTAQSRLDELHVLSRQGLWGLLIFFAASAVALYFRDLTLTATLPVEQLEQLGPRPPVLLINIVLGVSTLSSLINIFGRLYNSRKPGSTTGHLCFRLSFFVLYFISDALAGYLNVVFISGLAVLALQHYHITHYTSRAIERKTGEWSRLSI